jgi:ubiquinone/menaquinone biosynthesis C-methylase UbiE
MPVYDNIGKTYDVTRRADAFITRRLSYYLNIKDGGTYLDIACGTGNYTIALCHPGARFWGIDESSQMIDTAHSKANHIGWCQGTTEALPFRDGSFSGAVCVLVIHYFKDLLQVFSEVARVLLRGNFVVFTATPEQMRHYWLNHYFPEAMKRSIEEIPTQQEIADALHKAGFSNILLEPYEIKEGLNDFFLYSGKHKPEMYLEPQVRKGISTFTRLAGPDEVTEGCGRLKGDIRSGRIKEVIASYQSVLGDYLFITGQKL